MARRLITLRVEATLTDIDEMFGPGVGNAMKNYTVRLGARELIMRFDSNELTKTEWVVSGDDFIVSAPLIEVRHG
jgi:hypothetical protein